MKTAKRQNPAARSGVERILLQMIRRGDNWAGKATSFTGPAEFHFDTLKDLFAWLKRKALERRE
jgi:hypothetical protein